MRPASIRARLTLWYFAVQAITFAAFGIGIFFAVRGSVHAAIDEDLRQRLQGIRRFMDRIGRPSQKKISPTNFASTPA